MTRDQQYAPHREIPLLYWTTLLYIVGVPNFLHFDTSGRTHGNGLFNLTSLSEILLTLIAAYVLFLTLILERRPAPLRRVRFAAWLWVPLLAIFSVATILQPDSRLTINTGNDILISFYRIFEWLVAFGLILSVYRRVPPEQATRVMVNLIGRAAWIWLAMVWLLLPIIPSQVYGESEGMAEAAARLGGQLISPSYLATLAIAAFFYALLFVPRGLLRWEGCLLALVTLVLAHTRIEQLSFLILLFVYAVFLSGKTLLRILAFSIIGVVTGLGLVFEKTILDYLARGQKMQTVATLDGRLGVWQASLEAAQQRLWLGYGFVVGAKDAIRDHWVHTYWIPPHAHNEYIHALVTGGIVAAILVIALYIRMLWSAVRCCRRDACGVFLLLLAILFLVRSLGGSNFTIGYTRAGAAFLLTFIAIVAGDRRSRTAWTRAGQRDVPADPVLQEAGEPVAV